MPENTKAPQKTVDDELAGWRDVKSELLAPTLQYDALGRGMIVRYSGTRKLTSRGRNYTLHKFFSRAGQGQPFELWGAAQLNGKVKALRPNAVIYLRYDGKVPDPENSSQEIHTFTVREAPASANLQALVAGMSGAADGLDREIRLATDREKERRRDARGEWPGDPEPPEHTDADLPF